MNDLERPLLALADPLTWEWHGDTAQQGFWLARAEKANYRVASPPHADDVDAPPFQRLWGLDVALTDGSYTLNTFAASQQAAKDLATRHALTGDLAEINAVDAAYQAANDLFWAQKQAARKSLVNSFHARKITWLKPYPTDNKAHAFRITGSRGTYAVKFDVERRWVATFTRPDRTTEQHCFHTRPVAEMACSYHAQIGEWRGML